MQNKKGLALSQSKGFTIIELIVVIAIIAILAAVVMVNVTQYINKSKDAAIKASLGETFKAAVAYFEAGNSNAGWLCANTVSMFNQVAQVAGKQSSACYGQYSGNWPRTNIQGGTTTASCGCYGNPNSTNWYVYVKLSDGTCWCADSAGANIAVSCNWVWNQGISPTGLCQ